MAKPSTPPTDLRDARIGIIGTGVMAEAMLARLVADKLVDPAKVICSHPAADRRAELAERYGVQTVADNRTAVLETDAILLAIKPQVLAEVAADLRGRLRPDQLLISILAGATTAALSHAFDHRLIVRAMPNTPAQIGEGITVWFATKPVSDHDKNRVRALLGALGRELEVHDERQVAMATALSGTGPMYVFLFLEAMVDAGVHLGFPRHIARDLAVQTLVGSGKFAQQSQHHVAELRDMVTSPGGTSADALYELESGRLRTVINDAVWAAFGRTLELEAKLEGKPAPTSARNRPR